MMLSKNKHINTANIPYNWPTVGTLLFLMGIPAIPAMFGLVLVALGPSGDGASFINSFHFNTPSAIFVHGSAGILLFITMPFQFSPRVRANNPKRHKLAGRIAVISGCVMAISGIWMHNVLSPESQGIRYSILIMTSTAICISFIIAVYHVIKGNIPAHQKWMVRSVALVLAAVTPLFVDIFIMVLFSNFEVIYDQLIQLQYDYGRLLGIFINLSIVEIIMNKKHSRH